MVAKDPKDRISIEDLKRMEWYKGPVYSKREVQKLLNGKVKPMNKLL